MIFCLISIPAHFTLCHRITRGDQFLKVTNGFGLLIYQQNIVCTDESIKCAKWHFDAVNGPKITFEMFCGRSDSRKIRPNGKLLASSPRPLRELQVIHLLVNAFIIFHGKALKFSAIYCSN